MEPGTTVAAAATRGEYRRREPERSVLHRIVSEHLDQFLARAGECADGRGLPHFVERELRAYLRCGLLEHGFVRVHCDDCGGDALVAFSCKGRGFCPSCGGRRMASTAAHLVDRVLPRVPFRQWVLSVPIPLRYRIAFERALCRRVRNVFVRAVLGFLRRRGLAVGIRFSEVGAVTAVQRFGSALNLNVHFHTLAFDGAFRSGVADGDLQFVPFEPPTAGELQLLVRRIRARVLALLRRLRVEGDEADGPLAGCGPPLRRRRRRELARETAPPKADCAELDGFSLHAGVRVAARDRGRLERLCRYLVRPPISDRRLAITDDGTIALELKTPYSDGTTHFVLDPLTFLSRLAALVPPPHAHQVLYHGVLASAAAMRRHVIPCAPVAPATSAAAGEQDARESAAPDAGSSRSRNDTWADLMKRVFAMDVLRCSCGGARRMIAVITRPDVVRAILHCLDLAPLPAARGPPTDATIVLEQDPAIDPAADDAPLPLDDHSSETRLVID